MSAIVSDFTVTTVSSASARGFADAIMLVSSMALLAFLIMKDISSGASSRWLSVLSRGLNIAVAPLAIAFLMIAAARMVTVIR